MALKHQEYLTKSKFKMGLDCPKQIYYYNNRDKYADSDVDDDFMKSLAKGGFQVGEYAKSEYPEGINVDGHGEGAIERTAELLKLDQVVIFEAALVYENLLIRADILVKDGNYIKLIEVKAKSLEAHWFDDISDEANFQDYLESKSYEGIMNKTLAFAKDESKRKFKLNSEWMPYVYDIAFQTYVAKKAYPHWYIESYLCCPDKNAVAEVEGLNQLFMVKDNEKGQTEVKIMGDISLATLGRSVLTTVDVTWVVKKILANEEKTYEEKFEDKVNRFAQICLSNEKPEIVISSICKACRFNYDAEGKLNGFNECVKQEFEMTDKELSENPSILEIWSYKPNDRLQGRKAEKAGEEEVKPVYFIKDLPDSDFPLSSEAVAPLNQYNRQLLQVQKIKNKDKSEFLAKDLLRDEMEKFTFPLHFIDFETSMVAMPFNKDESPYKTIAFQFSHHILTHSGKVKHIGQYINLGHENPNVDFLRELKKQLSFDNGTIFRWSNHENSVVLFINRQLDALSDAECPDKEELRAFITAITTKEKVIGERSMVDMWDLYKKFHYMPETKGSNSIKAVLPAVIGRFKSLQSALSQPIYGKGLEYESLNFEEIAWFQLDENGEVADPYKLLPNIFDKYDREHIDLLFNDNDLKNGGTAMMAYAVSQFKIMTNAEKEKIRAALLRYCELDTFAMVIIYLYWYEQCAMEYIEEGEEA